MRVLVNGDARDVLPDTTIATLVPRHPGVAVALNGEVVRDWSRPLTEGDALEVVTALQGG